MNGNKTSNPGNLSQSSLSGKTTSTRLVSAPAPASAPLANSNTTRVEPIISSAISSTASASGLIPQQGYPYSQSSLSSYNNPYNQTSKLSGYLPTQYYNQQRYPDLIHTTLEINIMFEGDYENKTPIKLNNQMIIPKETMTRYGENIFFSPVIKYTDKLFRDAKVPQKITSFIDQNIFRKILIQGAKTQDIPKYESNKSVDIANANIEFMVNILFKKGNDINIPFDRYQYRNFNVRKLGKVTQFKRTEKNQMKKDKPIRIKIELSVVEGSKYKDMTKGDFARLDCKEKKEDLINHLYNVANRIPGINMKRDDVKPIKSVILPTLYGNKNVMEGRQYRNLNPYNRENQYLMKYNTPSSYNSRYSDYSRLRGIENNSMGYQSAPPYLSRNYSGGKKRSVKYYKYREKNKMKTKKNIIHHKKNILSRKKRYVISKKHKHTRRKTR